MSSISLMKQSKFRKSLLNNSLKILENEYITKQQCHIKPTTTISFVPFPLIRISQIIFVEIMLMLEEEYMLLHLQMALLNPTKRHN